MKESLAHIRAFLQKHKTLLILLTVLKVLLKIGVVLYFVMKANDARAQSTNSLLREGNKLYNKEKYNNATESYSKALQQAPKDVRANFNQGDALYKLNELDKAKEHYQLAAKLSVNTDIKSKAYYNIGNAWYKQEKYEESARAYKDALKLNPKDMDAKYNLMMALDKIKKNQGGGGKDQQKDKQQQDKQDKNQQQQNGNDKQQNNPQQKQQQGQQNKPQPQQQQMSNEEAQKLLEAIGNEESKVQQKLSEQKGKPQKGKVQKDW
jgi:Ca-activated chloride channel homolog